MMVDATTGVGGDINMHLLIPDCPLSEDLPILDKPYLIMISLDPWNGIEDIRENSDVAWGGVSFITSMIGD